MGDGLSNGISGPDGASHAQYLQHCRRFASLFSVALALTGCATKHDTRGPFVGSAPFSKTISGSGDGVCWSVKRALLSQGYMLERSSEPGVLTGTRDYQPEKKVNVTLHLQATCADNRNGTSIVFAAAEREESKLQKMKQSTGAYGERMPLRQRRQLQAVKRRYAMQHKALKAIAVGSILGTGLSKAGGYSHRQTGCPQGPPGLASRSRRFAQRPQQLP